MQNVPSHYPLTEDHLAQINSALEQGKIASQIIETAKRAGFDMSHFEQQHREITDKLRQTKNAFFPMR